MKIIKFEVGKEPYVKEIDGSLESMQAEVGGYIECVYPFEDAVVLICDEEGKLTGKETNRYVYDNGELVDIIVGDFFICGEGEEDLDSVPEELIDKYLHAFDDQ